MKQQVLEMRMAQIEAIAKDALKGGDHISALLRIIKVSSGKEGA